MFRDLFVKYRTNAQLKRNNAFRGSVLYEDAKNVGILYTAEDLTKHDIIKDLAKKFESDGKKVSVMSFLPKDVQNFEFRYNFFTDKEIGFFGNVNSEDVHTFVNKPFNYLLYVDFEGDPIMRYLLSMSRAQCRVGFFEEINRPFCDLMVAPQQPNYKSLAHEMYKYTKVLS
ncbi:DUF6913 domain-containing protein [Fulvivirga sedimenti]|uniref:Uncharacterized protein n=1 Tax=Fulvivirga sedimenti TaxID=2879465 RepID=A0A9X1HMW0_9BACT|nr:hypothetical protein [Fulvivirga sedimenti]MCA6074781.1 hypothetical protein [Fulvivirga sedimenti]MCA6075958.1 hypothetical protein [Fulvivirga sedimenti]MCA6077086.1 hypothetical protein [Fulvivirga sedimenti]